MCVFSCRRNGCQCWGIGGEDRAKGAGWTNLAAPKARADDAKGGESKRRRCGSRGAKPVGRRDWEPRGWTEGPGARAARKRVRPSTASASPRGDRAHAFLAGSQKSAGARLALERIALSLSRSLRPPLSTRLFLRVRRDLALVWVLVRVVSRAAPAAAALSSLPRAPRREPIARNDRASSRRAEPKRVFREHWLLFARAPLCWIQESRDIDLPFASTILEFWIPGTALHRKTEGRREDAMQLCFLQSNSLIFELTVLRNLQISNF